jgi:hypothetical protein
MKTLLMVLLVIAMLATLGVLFAGMLGFVRDDGNGERANRLMRWRVMLQGIALGLFLLLMLVSRG